MKKDNALPPKNRTAFVTGILAVCMGGTMLIPLRASWQETHEFPPVAQALGWLAFVLISVGTGIAFHERRQGSLPPLPMPVRITITGTILFLAFCAMEFSDGLVRQNGRVFYWTAVLFLPSLTVLYGLVLAHRWAWWTARIASALLALWFLVFLGVIPFADLQSNGAPIPWFGRVYAAIVTSVFAIAAGLAFRSLGTDEARHHFGLRPRLH